MLSEIVRNLRFALRALAKSPSFAVTALATLALCIGVNTAVFSVIDTVLLRPLPYPEADRLGVVVTVPVNGGLSEEETILSQDGATWAALRDHATHVDRAVFSGWLKGVNLSGGGRVAYVQQQRVSAGFFSVLGVLPLRGREFTRKEDLADGPNVAVLSHELWSTVLRSDPDLPGGEILLKGEPHTVVGVMPPGFRTSVPAGVWTPLRPSITGEGEGRNYEILTRLAPGVDWQRAEQQVAVIGSELPESLTNGGNGYRLGLMPYQRRAGFGMTRDLWMLMASVGLVLLVGCVNLTGLLLARMAFRQHEIATRMALGGGAGSVIRQLLTESVALGTLGGLLGLGVGYWGVRALESMIRETYGIWQPVQLDWRVLAMTSVVTLVTSLLFGMAPAIQASRTDLRSGLLGGGDRTIAGSSSRRLRRALLVGQVALVVVLAVGAGLLMRSYLHLRQLPSGFDPDRVLTAQLSLDDARYATSASVDRLFDESLDRIRALPGVESAAVALNVPYERGLNLGFRLMDDPGTDDGPRITNFNYVTPAYHESLGIPILVGRAFREADDAAAAKVAIVNEAFVRRYLEGRSPLGMRLGISGAEREIVGVSGDVQLTPGWGNDAPLWTAPSVYVPVSQTADGFLPLAHTWFSPSWIVRATASPTSLVPALERAMSEVDAQLPFASFRTVDELRAASLGRQQLQAMLLSGFSALALLLACVGIYGLIAGSVSERTRELGIRQVLGATPMATLWLVAAPGIALTLLGVVIGGCVARLSVPVIRHFLWGVTLSDPVTFVGVAAACLLVAAAASLLPALRVLRLSPARTLRDE